MAGVWISIWMRRGCGCDCVWEDVDVDVDVIVDGRRRKCSVCNWQCESPERDRGLLESKNNFAT